MSVSTTSSTSTVSTREPSSVRHARVTLLILAAASIVLIYSFFNSLSALWIEHWKHPQYSHGWLVPVFAAVLIWMRWDPNALQSFGEIPLVQRWCGAGLLAAGLSIRLVAAYLGMEVPDMWAFIPALAGIVLLVGGWRMFVWAGPIVAFLVFMFPLPWRIGQALLVPLQKIATVCSCYALQAMSYPATRTENIIHIEGVEMEIIDACSGLRMLTIFLALCGAVALVIDRPWWERLVIFLSAVPIALAVNMIRITATGVAHYHFEGSPEWIDKMFHDGAGLFMMPIAMVLLFIEVAVLSKLFIEDDLSPQPAAPSRPARGSALPGRQAAVVSAGQRRQSPRPKQTRRRKRN